MRYIELEEMKKIELNILRQFADYCDKNNLRYYLYAGTLLGAVRHEGFIPWDDDIDVIMPRPDFERFYELVQIQPISSSLDVMFYRDTEKFVCPFIKVVDNRTDGHEGYFKKDVFTGIWVDVFPMDGVPDEQKKRDDFIKKQQKNIKLLSLCTRPLVFTVNPLRMLKRFAIYVLYNRVDYKKVNRKLEERALKYDYDSSNLIGLTVFGGGHREVVPKKYYEETKKLPFEGLEFNVPANYDECLTIKFGDYMTPPPVEQRVRKHDYTAWWKEGFGPDKE